MTSLNQNITIFAGDTKNVAVTVEDDADVAIDITGVTIEYVVKKSALDAAIAQISKTVGSGLTLTTPLSGIFTINFLPADTQSLGYQEYYHEAELTDLSGNISTIFTGILTLEPSAT